MSTMIFHKFVELPLELRRKIWLEALLDATHDRTVVLNGTLNGVPPPGHLAGDESALRLWQLERQTLRVGFHLRSPVNLQLACRESRNEYCHVFNVHLPCYGRLAIHPALGTVSGGAALARTAMGGSAPVPRGCVHVSLQYDRFQCHNDLHVNSFFQGWGLRQQFLQRHFPVVAGPLAPVQIASIQHVVVVNWGVMPRPQGHPDYFTDAEAAIADPTLDALLGGVRSRVDHYLSDRSYISLHVSEARGNCFAEELEVWYPECYRLRFPQRASLPAEDRVQEEEEAGH